MAAPLLVLTQRLLKERHVSSVFLDWSSSKHGADLMFRGQATAGQGITLPSRTHVYRILLTGCCRTPYMSSHHVSQQQHLISRQAGK